MGFMETKRVDNGTGPVSLAGQVPSSPSISSKSAQSHLAAEPLIGGGVRHLIPSGQGEEQEGQPIWMAKELISSGRVRRVDIWLRYAVARSVFFPWVKTSFIQP